MKSKEVGSIRLAKTRRATEHLDSDSRVARAFRLALAIGNGRRVPDVNFDRLLPPRLGVVADQYWTPLEVAAEAARWLRSEGIRSVVDIGAGVGKFCIATALACPSRFIGIEQRPRLVACARGMAQLFNLEDRIHFVHGVFGEIEVPVADCYYLFNPFAENLFEPDAHLCLDDVELEKQRYARDIAAVEQFLASVPLGTYVLTYNGFGGNIPDDFEDVFVNRSLRCVLRLARRHRLRPVVA